MFNASNSKMSADMPRSSIACLSLLGFWMVLASHVCVAETIYQVEMIVFERTAPTTDEVWSKNLTLEYPRPWQRLFDPEEEAKRQEAISSPPSDDFLQTLARESAQLQQETDVPPPAQTSDATAVTVPQLPEFFAFLPRETRTLQKARDAIDRNQQLRVIFHEAWRQPLIAIEKSPALILRGGNRYGTHYELQGYIYLGISRFLHLHTNLWFTHFVPNHGQLPEHWPSPPVEPNELSSEFSVAPKSSEVGSDESESQPWTSDEMVNTDLDLQEAPYTVNQIVTLQQKRRMRSGELHYVDHPKLGILIKMTPEK